MFNVVECFPWKLMSYCTRPRNVLSYCMCPRKRVSDRTTFASWSPQKNHWPPFSFSTSTEQMAMLENLQNASHSTLVVVIADLKMIRIKIIFKRILQKHKTSLFFLKLTWPLDSSSCSRQWFPAHIQKHDGKSFLLHTAVRRISRK